MRGMKTRNVAALMAVALGALAPDLASARGGFGGHAGFGGGGFHGGGWGGGHHGGGWSGGYHGFYHGYRYGYGFGPGLAVGAALGLGLYAPYDDYPYYDYGYPAVAYGDGGGAVGCMRVHRRVHTAEGWRYRIVRICD